MFRFEDPYLLLFLLLIPLLIFLKLRRRKKRDDHIHFSNLELLREAGGSLRSFLSEHLYVLKILGIVLIITALARPQIGTSYKETKTKGIDIVLTLDTSTSMLAEDFKPKNRIKVAKNLASKFIEGRVNDRIGLVVFASKSYRKCPLTIDYGILQKLLGTVETGQIEDGTAIGMALANAVNILKNTKAKSKVVILLTDGRNNAGKIDPLTASETASAVGVKVYTIGVGKRGTAPYPVNHPVFGKTYQKIRVDIDEKTLKKIAKNTDGKYYRATDKQSLKRIFNKIDKLEKTEIKSKVYTNYTEIFPRFAIPGLVFFVLYILLNTFVLRRIP